MNPPPDGVYGGARHLLYITAALPFSSMETFFVPEIEEIRKRGVRVTVIPIRPGRSILHEDARGLAKFTMAEPLMSLSVIGAAMAEILRSPVRVMRAAWLLTRSRGFPILLKNLAVLPKGLWLARAARLQGADHIHAHWASTSATAALIAGEVSGLPWSFTAHRWDIPEDNLLHEKARTARFVRTIDVQGARELSEMIAPYRHKLRVIHMGVAIGPPSPRSEPPSPEGLRVVMGARFEEVKGHRYALEAIAQLKAAGVHISLHCAGDGSLKIEVENYARTLDILDRVEFPGLVDHRELLAHLMEHRWDIALLPSIVTRESREGIPVFLIEAMAAGLPVVATNTGGIPELLENGAGLLIPERDAGAIAESLGRLAADTFFRHRLAETGARRILDHFSIEASVSALLEHIYPQNQSDKKCG